MISSINLISCMDCAYCLDKNWQEDWKPQNELNAPQIILYASI